MSTLLRRRMRTCIFCLLIAALVALPAVGCATQRHASAGATSTSGVGQTPSATTSSRPEAAAATSAVAPTVKPLTISPEKGPAGTKFTIKGTGLPANASVTFVWETTNGAYDTSVSPENVEFHTFTFSPTEVKLGEASTDDQGNVEATATAPKDFGEVHDVRAVVNGTAIAQGGFVLQMTASMMPASGPVGTPITISMTGIPYEGFQNTLGLDYDNHYMGFISAVTTHGSATFQIRAAGATGDHLVSIRAAAHAVPYLNLGQSPVANFPLDRDWHFQVTDDTTAPANILQFPDPDKVNFAAPNAQHTTASATPGATSAKLSLDPLHGPVGSTATLSASGLPKNTPVLLSWISVTGNRVQASGWSMTTASPFPKVTTSSDGSLNLKITIPDGLGGWHSLEVVRASDKSALGNVSFFVDRSLVQVTPKVVHAGDKVTIEAKGIGWTEIDNGFAATYDNAYIGFACGFNSNGDVTFTVTATGGPGVHIVDLYPMIFLRSAKSAWDYQVPQLTALTDDPGLAISYNLPIYRLAFTIAK